MDPNEMLRLVDTIHRDKNIDKEVVFDGIEAALISAAKKHYGEDEDIEISIDRDSGAISGTHNGEPLSPEEMTERIGAQTAKQVMIQKIREAERDTLFDEYEEMRGQLVTGVIQRYENGTGSIALTNTEAILPRSEQIPGETHHVNERVRATVYEVSKRGSRIKVILSRCKPQLVERLFEQEIPEIAEGVIEIRSIAREPGYRSKVAVSSTDPRIDSVGACVGVRGNRIKNIVDELAGERIDIVRYSDDMQVLIPNALQPAEVEELILCEMLGKAIVLVREDQLSLAIGKRGQNVRLASKLCGWDIEIMTREELDDGIEQAVVGFAAIEGVDDEVAERLVGEGFLTYEELSIVETDALMEMGVPDEATVESIRNTAEAKAEEADRAAEQQRRRQREQDRLEAAAAAKAEAEAQAEGAAAEVAGETGETGETEAEVQADTDATADESTDAAASAETEQPPAAQPEEPTGEVAEPSAVGVAATVEPATQQSEAEEPTTAEADVETPSTSDAMAAMADQPAEAAEAAVDASPAEPPDEQQPPPDEPSEPADPAAEAEKSQSAD